MANVKISELNPLLTVQDADVLPIVDNGVTKKVTAAILQSYTQGNSVLLTGAQTIAGIKTFTSQLASTVATGTAPFSVASTTKVTNLNADLLDGLSSAAFQGALTLTTTGSSGASTLNTNTLNVPNYTLAGLGGVPYTGATQDVNLGTNDIYANKSWLYDEVNDNYGSTHYTDGDYHIEDADGHKLLVIEDGFMQIHKTDTIQSNLYTSGLSETRDHYLPNASGTLALTSDLSSYVPTTRTVSTTSPLTGGGALSSNLTLSIGESSASTNGYLSSGNFTKFNTAYNDSIVSAAVTGTTTKTLTLNQQDGGSVTASWTDDNTDAVTSVFGRTGAVVAASGDYTTTQVTEGTNLYYTEARVNANTNVAANTAARHNAVTLGTANGLSLSTQQLSLGLASGSATGALSSTDWTTFNNKASTAALANYLPLAGGTLTGALNGTSGTFTGNVSSSGQLRLESSAYGSIVVGSRSSETDFQIYNTGNIFRIYNGTSDALNINTSGNVGIGTTSPSDKLTVAGGILSTGGFIYTTAGALFAQASGTEGTTYQLNGITAGYSVSGSYGWITAAGASARTSLALNAGGGNVLIGTTTDAGYKLDVNGTARLNGAVKTKNLQVAGASGGYTTGDNPMIGFGSAPVSGDFGSIEVPFGDKMIFNQYHGYIFKTSKGGASPVPVFSIGINGTINFSSLPTSSAGLSAGDIWNDGGTLKIV
jgi:cytoskeletal protein CcmA (bactofilin family)